MYGTHDQSDAARPSAWARERFGRSAGVLVAAVPARLDKAHRRAQAAHLAVGLKKAGPYGDSLLKAAREELAEEALQLGGAARDLLGRPYPILNDHALFPFRYADHPMPLERARLKQAPSPHRRRLFTAHGPAEQEALFPMDDSLSTEAYEQLHAAFEQLGEVTKLVSVFFTSDVQSGIHTIHWGDARLEPDRTFSWAYQEALRPFIG